MVVYDITKRESFEHVAAWIHEARINVGSSQCVFELVGHKADLEAERQVLYEEGEYFAKHHKCKFLETSAKSGYNIDEAFAMIARDIHGKIESGAIQISSDFEGVKSGLVRSHSAISLTEPPERSDSACMMSACWARIQLNTIQLFAVPIWPLLSSR